MICVSCRKKTKSSRKDKDFCQSCFDRIENPMPYVQAAVRYINIFEGEYRKKLEMYAFMSIFHPKVTHETKMKMCEDLK